MSVYRAQISFPFDSALPRDVMTMNPHYRGDNPQALADKLKANLIANPGVTTKPFTVKIYDAQKPPPSYPLATAQQTGTTPAHPGPRELAMCLSYYATNNRKRERGRIYIPIGLLGAVTFGLRPSAGTISAALAFASVFNGTLPTNHLWVVYSRLENVDRVVTNWWVDDEWDIMRSRGLRGTTRQLGP